MLRNETFFYVPLAKYKSKRSTSKPWPKPPSKNILWYLWAKIRFHLAPSPATELVQQFMG